MKGGALQGRAAIVVSPLDIDAHIYERAYRTDEAGDANEVQRRLTTVNR